MRYTRHAKNRLRGLRMEDADVEWLIANPRCTDRDQDGNFRFLGEIHGVPVRVVVALDEPDLVVTIHPRENR